MLPHASFRHTASSAAKTVTMARSPSSAPSSPRSPFVAGVTGGGGGAAAIPEAAPLRFVTRADEAAAVAAFRAERRNSKRSPGASGAAAGSHFTTASMLDGTEFTAVDHDADVDADADGDGDGDEFADGDTAVGHAAPGADVDVTAVSTPRSRTGSHVASPPRARKSRSPKPQPAVPSFGTPHVQPSQHGTQHIGPSVRELVRQQTAVAAALSVPKHAPNQLAPTASAAQLASGSFLRSSASVTSSRHDPPAQQRPAWRAPSSANLTAAMVALPFSPMAVPPPLPPPAVPAPDNVPRFMLQTAASFYRRRSQDVTPDALPNEHALIGGPSRLEGQGGFPSVTVGRSASVIGPGSRSPGHQRLDASPIRGTVSAAGSIARPGRHGSPGRAGLGMGLADLGGRSTVLSGMSAAWRPSGASTAVSITRTPGLDPSDSTSGTGHHSQFVPKKVHAGPPSVSLYDAAQIAFKLAMARAADAELASALGSRTRVHVDAYSENLRRASLTGTSADIFSARAAKKAEVAERRAALAELREKRLAARAAEVAAARATFEANRASSDWDRQQEAARRQRDKAEAAARRLQRLLEIRDARATREAEDAARAQALRDEHRELLRKQQVEHARRAKEQRERVSEKSFDALVASNNRRGSLLQGAIYRRLA
jgi:hypothetical protein